MRSNTSSSDGLGRSGGAPAGLDGLPARPEGLPPRLEALAAVVDEMAADDPGEVGDALLATEVVAMRRLVDRLEADWLRRLATVDGRGAAGAELGAQAPSAAGWLRARCRLSPALAGQQVRTARALHRGPLAGTAAALAAGEVSPQHAAVLADATSGLPPRKVAEAEPVLVDAARRLDTPRLRRLAAHLREVIDPTPPRPGRRPAWTSAGCRLPPPSTAWSPSTGCWTPRPARPPWLPWPPWPGLRGPTTSARRRSGAPTRLASWPATPCKPGTCRRAAGCGRS